MNRKIPTYQDEFELLGEFWPTLWQAYEGACELTRQYFTEFLKVDAVDPYLAPEIQRYQARQLLAQLSGHDTSVEYIPLSQNGISLVRHGRKYRIWKKPEFGMPSVRSSNPMFDFMNQRSHQYPLPCSEGSFDLPTVDWHLALLWVVDAEFHFAGFHLALPASAAEDSPTQVHWIHYVSLADIDKFIISVPPDTIEKPEDLPFTSRETEEDDERAAQ